MLAKPRVVLVNPSNSSVGFSVTVPRWLYVIAAATPIELVGDPIVFDEPVRRFDASCVGRGDIVGIGIHTGNCLAGYRALRDAKANGATVVMGGVHATLVPEECLSMGADAVVTGNGDLVWPQVVKDALAGVLQRRYDGGRVPGESLLKAEWRLLDPRHYLMATLQTVAGCPENCSFCSVWVTDGRKPRQHLASKVIEEANELYRLGFRFVFFADDNFTPATLDRITRESNPAKRQELERLRQERLRFFEEYGRGVPEDLLGLTQMTIEVATDPEYLDAMCRNMRIRGALVGVESFTEEGLRETNKAWSPAGANMVEAIRDVQNAGIFVLSSVISGLESDSLETIRGMRRFARESGTALAQFPIFSPYPGTVDYHALVKDKRRRETPGYVAARGIQIIDETYWLHSDHFDVVIRHPRIAPAELRAEVSENWRTFYSLRAILSRVRNAPLARLPWVGRLLYVGACFCFRLLYRNGIAADTARAQRLGLAERMAMSLVVLLSRTVRGRTIHSPPES